MPVASPLEHRGVHTEVAKSCTILQGRIYHESVSKKNVCLVTLLALSLG
jgi:hypothetical protein